jgi:hypothetical protein
MELCQYYQKNSSSFIDLYQEENKHLINKFAATTSSLQSASHGSVEKLQR